MMQLAEPAVYRYSGPLKRKVEFSVSDNTALWLGRMLVGEGGQKCTRSHAQVMLWTLANRYCLHPGQRHWGSFISMMRLFSQPINPRWNRGGDLAAKYEGRPEASEARLNRRAEICAMTWDELSTGLQEEVAKFAYGDCPRPEVMTQNNIYRHRLSNWGSYPGVKDKFPWGVNIHGNWFFEDKELLAGNVELVK